MQKCKKIEEFSFEDLNAALSSRTKDSIDRLLIGSVNKFHATEFVVLYRHVRLLCSGNAEYLPEHQKRIFWKKVAEQLAFQRELEGDLGVLTIAQYDDTNGLDLYLKIKCFIDSFSLNIDGDQAIFFEGFLRNVICDPGIVLQSNQYENFVASEIEERIKAFLDTILFKDEYWIALYLVASGNKRLNERDRKSANAVCEKIRKNLGELYVELCKR